MLMLPEGAAALRAAVRRLGHGGVIAFPTETTYGLGCDPRKAAAVRRLFAIKGRPAKKPVLLVASSLADVRKVAEMPVAAVRLAAQYWPGPLTLVLPRKKGVRLSPLVAPGGMVAIRVSSSLLIQRLVRAYGFPVIATSANRSDKPPACSGRAVMRAFHGCRDVPDLIVDAGSLPRRKPSTVAQVQCNGEVMILRQGHISLHHIRLATLRNSPRRTGLKQSSRRQAYVVKGYALRQGPVRLQTS